MEFVDENGGGPVCPAARAPAQEGRRAKRYTDQILALSSRTVAITTVALGALMGLLVTATSVGAGAIGVTALLLLHPRLSAARVVGSDIAHAVPLTVLAGLGHWWLGSIHWTLLGTLLIGSLPGILVGSYVAGRARDGVVRWTLAVVLLVVALRLVL